MSTEREREVRRIVGEIVDYLGRFRARPQDVDEWVARLSALRSEPEGPRKAWVRASPNLKACPDCGAVTLEGFAACSDCGCEPADDMSWRCGQHDFAEPEGAPDGE